jgi:hypothetical protein
VISRKRRSESSVRVVPEPEAVVFTIPARAKHVVQVRRELLIMDDAGFDSPVQPSPGGRYGRPYAVFRRDFPVNRERLVMDDAGFISTAPPSPGVALSAENDPTWRWRTTVDWLLRNQRNGRDAGLDEAADVTDPIIALWLEPYLRRRCGLPATAFLGEDEYQAVHAAVRLYGDRRAGRGSQPFQLEAGIVAGLPPGAALPDGAGVDEPVQRLYGQLFFDIRSRLADREWLLRHVFGNPWQTARIAARGFRWKVFAHALGADGYAAWRDGATDMSKARRVDFLLRQVMAYLNGLKALAIARSTDAPDLFGWLFRQVDRLPDGGEYAPPFTAYAAEGTDFHDRLRTIAAAIPAERTAAIRRPYGGLHCAKKMPRL